MKGFKKNEYQDNFTFFMKKICFAAKQLFSQKHYQL